MKYKLAILFSFLSWFTIYLLSLILTPYYIEGIQYINILIPISIIAVTIIVGILYIREIDGNEVIEGFYFGIMLFIVDCLLDLIHTLFIGSSMTVSSNLLHVISMLSLFTLTTTLLGYLAQMNVELT